MTLTGKIAVVTGASRGIGEAISLALANAGVAVIGTATTNEGANNISTFFEERRLNGKGVMLDVAQQSSIDELAQIAESTFGVPEILINNAAITMDNLMLRMKDEEWEKVLDVNLTAVYRMTKTFLKGMIKARWGRIVNITSVVGVTGNAGQANYSAAKAGLIGFTKSIAQEVASRNITANCVAPGFIDTDMTRQLNEKQKELINAKIPMNRMGKPDDIAAAVAFLVSFNANYITGETLHVNGGMYMG